MNPPISILIRTFNSARTLGEVLARLGMQPEDELIIVDSGSSDTTLAIAEKHHARIVHAEPPFNYSKSLNLGFAAAKKPWVLVISSHCVPQSENLLECFRAAAVGFPESVAVAYGVSSLTEYPATLDPTLLFADQKSTPAQQRVIGSSGNSLALYRRDHWQHQVFDESLVTAEDLAWLLRALENGAVAARLSQARVLYRNQGSLRHMFSKGWRESRMVAEMTGIPATTLFQLGINLISLLKKWGFGKIPMSTLLRQGAHALGAYLALKFSNKRSNTEKILQ